MKRILVAAATLLAASWAVPTSAQTTSYTVNCAVGQTISQALVNGDARKPLLVVIRGTCSEYVTIARSDVTLRGVSVEGSVVNAPGTAAPAITIQADRVSLEQLTVTGGANGVLMPGPFVAAMTGVVVRSPGSGSAVLVRGGGDLTLNACTLTDANIGLQLQRGGSARVFNGSEIRDNYNAGVFAGVNSTITIGSSKVTGNGGHGIEVQSGSQGNINNNEIANNQTGVLVGAAGATVGSGNVIHDNREHGVLAQGGATVGVDNNTIRDNGRIGVFGYLGATVALHGNEITDNAETGVACRSNCTLQIGGARITRNGNHGVSIQLRSTLILEGPATNATGNYGWVDLWCGDSESSADGLAEYFLGSTYGCTGFDN